MGQQQSNRAHELLTFGYVNSTRRESGNEGIESDNRERSLPDLVLDNPHLYRLESTCPHCAFKTNYSVMAAEAQSTQLCRCGRQEKSFSLVRSDLANDLNYIDETYYPNIVHYEEKNDDDNDAVLNLPAATSASINAVEDVEDDSIMSDHDDTDTLRNEEGWSRLTLGEITPNSAPKRQLDLSGRSLIKLSSSIGHLDNLTKLDLSGNQMINLPKAIGRLKNLCTLNASKNQLETIPDTITGLVRLKALNLSHNHLITLPKGTGSLPSLLILLLNHNRLSLLPRELSNLDDLITLNVSYNPLKTIPAEISAIKSLRKLTAEGCAFGNEMVHTLAHDPPSLFEICARNMARSNISLPASLRQHHIADYFQQKQACSFCFGPYFESFVTRSRFIERAGRQVIALDYQLCCAHWTDENDRVFAMFSMPYYKQQTHPVAPNIITNSSGASTPMTQQQQPSSMIETDEEDPLLPEQHVQPQESFPTSCSNSEDIHCLPTTAEKKVSTSAITAVPTATITTSISLLSSSPSSSKPTRRPRSASASSLRRAHAATTHRCQLPSSPALLQSQHQDLALPFAALPGRQAQEADHILSRQSAVRRPNAFKHGFAQLGARLSKKSGNHSINNQSNGSASNGTCDRSETV
ncbi:hypothetical protein [Parasitella parasitica]|uniref:L domain-like protein n=1 Tax=Parasitella parasitica TaxID=35722 RepID=A0A0B7N986_9FUNG|nr:hypothetical protein [Parasitella parasitica]